MFLFFLTAWFGAFAQNSDTTDTAKKDTSNVKSDTLSTPFIFHGSVDPLNNFYYPEIKKEEIQLINYTNFEDIFISEYQSFPVNLGEEGKLNNFSFMGASPRSNIFAFNGIRLNSKLTGNYNPNFFPVEFFEEAEILKGTDAVVEAGNPGVFINFREIIYNTDKPYTKFWYSQEAYNFIGVDGIFSQNFMKNLNLNFGFRTISNKGRFDNSDFNSWNVRTNLRWNPSDLSSVSLLYNFLNFGNSHNGGIDVQASEDPFDPINSFVRFQDLRSRKFINDIQLSYSLLPDKDSTTSIYASLKYQNTKNNFKSGNDFYFIGEDSIDQISGTINSINAYLKVQQNIFGAIRFSAGGDLEYVDIPSILSINKSSYFNLNAFSKIKINLLKDLALSTGFRLNNNYGKTYLTGGSKLYYKKKNYSASFDLSFSQTTSNLFQGDLLNEKHVLSLFELDLDLSPISFGTNIYLRNVIDPIFSELTGQYSLDSVRSYNADNMRVLGANISVSSKIFKLLNLSLNLKYNNTVINSERSKLYPEFSGTINTFYEYELPRSYLRAGFDFKFFTSHKHYGYIPIYEIYYLNDKMSGFSTNGLNLYLSAKLGRAFIKATMQNVLSQDYYYVYLYPQTGRNLRLSVSWSFFD